MSITMVQGDICVQAADYGIYCWMDIVCVIVYDGARCWMRG